VRGAASACGFSIFLRLACGLPQREDREEFGHGQLPHRCHRTADGSRCGFKGDGALHKEQFGRGPTRARSNFAGKDALLCVLEDALLPAELAMVQLGDQHRVRESRLYLQVATADAFIAAVEEIVHRTVRGFSSATDPDVNMVFEVFSFEPEAAENDGRGPSVDASRLVDPR
jgi:uncharacterized protein YbcI